MLHAVIKSDLRAISGLYTLLEYADITTLVHVVPEHTDVSIHDEFEHVKVWASVLLFNHREIKEIVFKRPRALHFYMLPGHPSKRLSSCIVLNWLVLNNGFSCTVNYIAMCLKNVSIKVVGAPWFATK